nr:sulfurtransferase [Sphingomonas jejuensis]
MDALVSADWLQAALGAPDLRVVNASKHLPDERRDPRAEHAAGHIPGARFMDLDAFGGGTKPIPTSDEAGRLIGALGIGVGTRIVIYDDSPLHSAARGWWLLREYGLRDVAILDGGLAAWRARALPLETGDGGSRAESFSAGAPGGSLRTMADVRANLDSAAAQLVDARSAGRFAGMEPEPHPGVQPGHVPGALNVPQGTLFHPDGTWKREGTLRAAFEDAGVEVERPVIATCGSGVTAAVIAFGLHLLGRPDAGLYNGSWSEWGADPSTPKATGA